MWTFDYFYFDRSALPGVVCVLTGTVVFALFAPEWSWSVIFFVGGLFGSLRYNG